MARELLPALDPKRVLEGHMTPIWFGSAINSFGVKELMDGIGKYGPEPQIQSAEPRQVAPEEPKVSGFVFKVQANMDPNTATASPLSDWHQGISSGRETAACAQ